MTTRSPALLTCAITALGLSLVACSSGGSGSGTTAQSARQALVAAATSTQQVTSASERLLVRVSGAQSQTTTGTILVQLKPTVQISENIKITAGGTSTGIKAIVTSNAFYLSEPAFSKQFGKPWLKISLNALTGTAVASLGALVRSIQGNNFANQAELLTIAKNTHVVGTQMIDGVSTIESAGSFPATEATKVLPAAFRKVLGPALHALGNSVVSFHVWVDGQHHIRKMVETETVNAETINTTVTISAINQPVHIAIPPASQTAVPPGL
jgi:hypothetical protein